MSDHRVSSALWSHLPGKKQNAARRNTPARAERAAAARGKHTDTMLAGQLSIALCSQLVALVAGSADPAADGAGRGAALALAHRRRHLDVAVALAVGMVSLHGVLAAQLRLLVVEMAAVVLVVVNGRHQVRRRGQGSEARRRELMHCGRENHAGEERVAKPRRRFGQQRGGRAGHGRLASCLSRSPQAGRWRDGCAVGCVRRSSDPD